MACSMDACYANILTFRPFEFSNYNISLAKMLRPLFTGIAIKWYQLHSVTIFVVPVDLFHVSKGLPERQQLALSLRWLFLRWVRRESGQRGGPQRATLQGKTRTAPGTFWSSRFAPSCSPLGTALP